MKSASLSRGSSSHQTLQNFRGGRVENHAKSSATSVLKQSKTSMYSEGQPFSAEGSESTVCKHANCKRATSLPKGQEDMVSSQALYIDNLKQQVYFLENEISYLRGHMEKLYSTSHPGANYSEAEKMVKNMADTEKEIQKMKIDVKRKQTSIDLLKSEKLRLLHKAEANEATYFRQKTSYLEEIEDLKKSKDNYYEKCIELERTLQEKSQRNGCLQENVDSLTVQLEQLKNELSEEKKNVKVLEESKKTLQRSLIEASMHLEAKSVIDDQEAIKILKDKIMELNVQLVTAGKIAEHEKILRSHVAEENDALIQRHASMEAELAEVRAKLREEQGHRASLEELHLKTVVEASSAKSDMTALKSEISSLKQQVKAGKEKLLQLSSQVADEQRHKAKEEQRATHLERRLEQKEQKSQAREKENTDLFKDNVALRDQVVMLKQDLNERDAEVEDMKGKVAEMQISVEEFVESTKAANRIEGKRWKQLTQLAQGIQSLSKDALLGKED